MISVEKKWVQIYDIGTNDQFQSHLNIFNKSFLIIFLFSLSEFQIDDRLQQLQQIQKKMNETQRLAIIFTKRDILKVKLESMEERKRDLNEFFPEIQLGSNYKLSQLKIEEYLLERVKQDLNQQISENVSFHFLSNLKREEVTQNFTQIVMSYFSEGSLENTDILLKDNEIVYKDQLNQDNIDEETLQNLSRELSKLELSLDHPLLSEVERRVKEGNYKNINLPWKNS